MSLQSRLADLITAVGADYKRLTGVVTTTSTSTLTPSASVHQYNLTAQAATLTLASPTGSPFDGQSLMIRIKDNGTIRTINWTTGSAGSYRAVGVTLPTATVAGKVLYVGAKWNAADSRWDVLAIGQEA